MNGIPDYLVKSSCIHLIDRGVNILICPGSQKCCSQNFICFSIDKKFELSGSLPNSLASSAWKVQVIFAYIEVVILS